MRTGDIVKAVLKCCKPRWMILYGEKSPAGSNELKAASLCIILDECNKKLLLPELYLKVNMPIPINFLLYSTEEWKKLRTDDGSYASAIKKKGTVLYGETS